MATIDPIVRAVAVRQHGLITHEQAIDLGASSSLIARRLRSGHWQLAGPRVYVVGAVPRTFRRRVLAVVLSLGPGTVVSHRTGAFLRGLLPRTAVPIEVTVPYERSVRRRGVVVHRSLDLRHADVEDLDGIPITGVARTVLDLGAVAPQLVLPALNQARRSGLVEWDELLRCLVRHGRKGRRGVGPLRALVAEHVGAAATDSETEDEAERIMRLSRAVPMPRRQVPVVCADGVPVTIDFGWPDVRCLLEVFGVDHLRNEPLQHIDLHRRNQIELAGYRLLVYTGELLRRQPDQLIRDVRAMLADAGATLPDL